MNRVGVGVVVVLSGCALVAACSSSSPLAGPDVGTTSANDGALTHIAALRRGSLTAATLDVESGATSIDITVANLPGGLVSVSTPVSSSQDPALSLSSAGVANLALVSGAGGSGPSQVKVVLDSSVTWTIDLDGGATEEAVDMVGGHLALLDLEAGVTRARINLPARPGTQLIREEGGATAVAVSAPQTVATRVHVMGGAGSVVIGATSHTGIGGDQTFAALGYAHASQRLDLELQGGVSTVTVSPEAPG
jgi:hypothetical protein